MNIKSLLAPVAALGLLVSAGCASTPPLQLDPSSASCSAGKSEDNGASCRSGTEMAPPVVDISKPTPAPGVATRPAP